MTIRKATIPSKTRIGAHTPLFLRITTPAERRHIQTHPGETFLVPNEASETGGFPKRDVETIRAYANMLNKNGTFWVVDSRSDGQGGVPRVALLGPARGEATPGSTSQKGPGLTPAAPTERNHAHVIHRSH